jgi:pimeloyl-ACP methyl ester carboxylesterase
MKVEFIRFKATDGIELQGWFSEESSNIAALHIHGRSGTAYGNYFLDNLREMYAKNNISFFTINTRGSTVINEVRNGNDWVQVGSCFEIFSESAYDIKSAIQFLQSRNKTRFILQGHSLGCSKVINYCVTEGLDGTTAIVLLAPTDMVGWAKRDSRHSEHMVKAKQLLAAGRGKELVDFQCWNVDKVPISAQTYPTICEENSAVDIYGLRNALLGKIAIPMLMVYGTDDIGVIEVDGSIDNWRSRVLQIKNPNTQIAIIANADHGFRNHEEKVAKAVEQFVTSVVR